MDNTASLNKYICNSQGIALGVLGGKSISRSATKTFCYAQVVIKFLSELCKKAITSLILVCVYFNQRKMFFFEFLEYLRIWFWTAAGPPPTMNDWTAHSILCGRHGNLWPLAITLNSDKIKNFNQESEATEEIYNGLRAKRLRQSVN